MCPIKGLHFHCPSTMEMAVIDLDDESGTEYRQYLNRGVDDTHVNLGTLSDLPI